MKILKLKQRRERSWEKETLSGRASGARPGGENRERTTLLSDFLSSLRITKQFADVTLVCDNQQEISAHKVVLGACSPMLATILSHHSNEENATIYLDGVDLSDMQTL